MTIFIKDSQSEMNLELQLQGTDATQKTLFSLQDWIRREQIKGLRVQPRAGVPREGDLGVEPITILSVVLSSAAVVTLVKSIHVWIQSTRPKIKVKLQIAENKTIEIDGQNLSEMDSLVDKVLAVMKDADK